MKGGHAKVETGSTTKTTLSVMTITMMKSVREPTGIWKFPITLPTMDACPSGSLINYRYK